MSLISLVGAIIVAGGIFLVFLGIGQARRPRVATDDFSARLAQYGVDTGYVQQSAVPMAPPASLRERMVRLFQPAADRLGKGDVKKGKLPLQEQLQKADLKLRTSEYFMIQLGAVLLGALIFCAIILPWLLALVSRTGAESVAQLLGHYTFGRYTGTIENQAGPIWYYLPVLILGFFPWVAFLPAAVVYGINQDRGSGVDDGNRGLIRLSLLWIVIPFLFFSFAKKKLPNYIALELPGLALLVTLYF